MDSHLSAQPCGKEDITTTTIDPPRTASAPPRPERRVATTGLPGPVRIPARRPPGPPRRPAARQSAARLAPYVVLALAVVAWTGGWASGGLSLDGPGASMWFRLLLRHWDAGEGIPSWIPDMWAGAPMWELTSSFPIAVLLPLARLVGPDTAVKLAIVGAQVVGAWGAFVLARSLWSVTWPAVVAGLIYGLHPVFATHGPLSGHQPFVWVFAAIPWLVWSLQWGLRRKGARYVALAGVLVGFMVIEQAELAFALVLLCAFILALEIARARRESGPDGIPGVLFRACAVVTVGLGVAAHWLLPFLTVGKSSFVLMPPEDVRFGLETLSGGLARKPGAFLTRAEPLAQTIDLEDFVTSAIRFDGMVASGFYLSWVCLVLTLVTIFWLARRSDQDGTLSAILLASAIGIWFTMGAIPLAEGGLADSGRVFGLATMGIMGGVLAGTFLRRLDLGRRSVVIGVVIACLLFVIPYFAPILALRRLIPMLADLRFPRFYPIAALAVALGATYPLVLARRWAVRRKPELAPLLTASICLAIAAAFFVDVSPYRSYYDLAATKGSPIYQEVAQKVAATGPDLRVATPYYGDPRPVANLLDVGVETSVGWPQPQATPNMWRLTAEVLAASPPGFRNAALGLSATSFVAVEQLSDRGQRSRGVTGVDLEPNPAVLPLVRAYEQTLVVSDGDLTPELATALAGRYVGVVRGGPDLVEVLGPGASAVESTRPCQSPPSPDGNAWIAAEIAMACSMHAWVGAREGLGEVTVGDVGVGAVFTSPIRDLRGISVWLEGGAGASGAGAPELVLREVADDGSFGGEILRTRASGIDDNGMFQFPFEPRADSAGRRYLFLLTCQRCGDDEPKLRTNDAPRGERNLVIGDRLDGEGSAAFSLLYDQLPAAEPPAVTLNATRPGPGRWKVEVSGPRPSVLVVAESYFPGWKAKVDGKQVPVVEADGAFLGVPVGSGSHEVELRYHRPAAAGLGQWITGLTILASLALMFAPGQPGGRRRRASLARPRPPR